MAIIPLPSFPDAYLEPVAAQLRRVSNFPSESGSGQDRMSPHMRQDGRHIRGMDRQLFQVMNLMVLQVVEELGLSYQPI